MALKQTLKGNIFVSTPLVGVINFSSLITLFRNHTRKRKIFGALDISRLSILFMASFYF
jgi:hypothetical protein